MYIPNSLYKPWTSWHLRCTPATHLFRWLVVILVVLPIWTYEESDASPMFPSVWSICGCQTRWDKETVNSMGSLQFFDQRLCILGCPFFFWPWHRPAMHKDNAAAGGYSWRPHTLRPVWPAQRHPWKPVAFVPGPGHVMRFSASPPCEHRS